VRDRLETQVHRRVLPSEFRGTRIVEVPVDASGPLAGSTLAQLRLPPHTLVVAIERQSQTIIPRGDSELRNGDRLQILVRDDAIAALHEHLANAQLVGGATRRPPT
jgi:Trk K+ transport system NAD-binding subunit